MRVAVGHADECPFVTAHDPTYSGEQKTGKKDSGQRLEGGSQIIEKWKGHRTTPKDFGRLVEIPQGKLGVG